MRYLITAVCVAAAFALSACADPDAIRSSWHGRLALDLADAWGPPTNKGLDERGAQTVIYRFKREDATLQTETGSKSLLGSRCTVVFQADARGVISSSKQDGSLGGCTRLLSDKPLGK